MAWARLAAAIEPFETRNARIRQFAGGRWWTGPQIESSSPARFDPNLCRFLAKVRSTLGRAP